VAFTQTQLDNLRAAIAVGALVVGTGSNRVEYRSLAEMERIEAMMAATLDDTPITQASETARTSITVFTRE